MQFYLQASIVEKGITIKEYKHSRVDVIVGCFIMYVVAFFIIIACAATIHRAGVKVESVAEAARALQPLAGKYASWLFAFGLLNASIFAASILPLSTVYYVCEGMGWEKGIDKSFEEAPFFYILYTSFIVIGALIVLVPKFPLLTVMFLSQVLNGVLLPFILIYILLLINNKHIMGEYINSKMYNIFSWIVVFVMITFTIIMLVTTFV
jgi:Mn2+/Fe2+ NRAMP family transporter